MKNQYNVAARWFHWTTAILVLTTIPIGIAMTEYVDSRQLRDLFFVLHESIGLSILVLTAARLGWRLLQGAPPPSKALSPVEILISHATHGLLYVILLAMPITGYLLVVAGGHPLSYFGLFAAPRIIARHKELSHFAESAHLALRWIIYTLVAMHVAAALHHHLARRNDVLSRMLPSARRGRRFSNSPLFDRDPTEPGQISVPSSSGD
jgi:cytochrome b561